MTSKLSTELPAAPGDRERRLFDALCDGDRTVSPRTLLRSLRSAGLLGDDPRLEATLRAVDAHDGDRLDLAAFASAVRPCLALIERAWMGDLVVPDFGTFTAALEAIVDEVRPQEGGHVATYIPQLARVNPEHLAVSVCTIDGQRASWGDADVDFCVQSCCKPTNYGIVLEEHGAAKVHEHVGREASGRAFNALTLNDSGLPHNPLINAGAIMACSLIGYGLPRSERFDRVMQTWGALIGGKARFSNAVYLSERETADRNFALGYFMREHGAFPEGTDLVETLEFYFQCCSIELNAAEMALAAATLAAGGVHPLTGERVFAPETVQAVLSVMFTSGMYDYSGEFAYAVGVPAKSGVSGCIMVVVPNTAGFCVWSPKLDEHGNSVRGVAFYERLVDTFTFHNFDNLTGLSAKRDPRRPTVRTAANDHHALLWAAADGDLEEIRQLVARGVDLTARNVDGRTALHIAAAEAHADVVGYLLERGADPHAQDRWERTPADEARRTARAEVMVHFDAPEQ